MGESPPAAPFRLDSLDILRGLVIVLMTLDHARDYFAPAGFAPEDLSESTPAWFLTRWVTHFCAPVFVFLGGTSISLRQFGLRQFGAGPAGGTSAGPGRPGMSRYLLVRGLVLIALELTIIGASWGFLFAGVVTLQVIWALGVSMLVMAALVRWHWGVSLVFGAAVVGLHNLLDPVAASEAGARVGAWGGPAWMVLHEQGWIGLGGHAGGGFNPPGVFVVYPLIPWPGVMALGYAFGRVMRRAEGRRVSASLALGLGATALFVLLRVMDRHGDPATWASHAGGHPWLGFVNTTKYPPSLQFLLMTLGPALVLIAGLDAWTRRGVPAVLAWVRVFGRVPMFYYLLHIPLLHVASAALWFGMFGVMSGWQVGGPEGWPSGYEPRLWVAYAAASAAVFGLYWPCRWFARLRQRRRDWWLSYL